MKKYAKKRVAAAETQIEEQVQQDVAAPGPEDILQRMQQQLSSIERKIDSLVNKQPAQHRQPDRQHGDARRERQMFKVVCADCGNECEVPFKPSGDRPVYCRECFSTRKNSSPFSERRDEGGRRAEHRREERHEHKHRDENARFIEKKKRQQKHKSRRR